MVSQMVMHSGGGISAPWILLSMLPPATIAVPVGELHCTAQAGSRDCIVPVPDADTRELTFEASGLNS